MSLLIFLVGAAAGVALAVVWSHPHVPRTEAGFTMGSVLRGLLLAAVGVLVGVLVIRLPDSAEALFFGLGLGALITYLVKFGPAKHPDYNKRP